MDSTPQTNIKHDHTYGTDHLERNDALLTDLALVSDISKSISHNIYRDFVKDIQMYSNTQKDVVLHVNVSFLQKILNTAASLMSTQLRWTLHIHTCYAESAAVN